jgi:hypothetical protein
MNVAAEESSSYFVLVYVTTIGTCKPVCLLFQDVVDGYPLDAGVNSPNLDFYFVLPQAVACAFAS